MAVSSHSVLCEPGLGSVSLFKSSIVSRRWYYIYHSLLLLNLRFGAKKSETELTGSVLEKKKSQTHKRFNFFFFFYILCVLRFVAPNFVA